jgi:hypothetical protein
MVSFIIQAMHLLFCWCYTVFMNLLWHFNIVNTQCKNRASRNYQRAAESFGKC